MHKLSGHGYFQVSEDEEEEENARRRRGRHESTGNMSAVSYSMTPSTQFILMSDSEFDGDSRYDQDSDKSN